MTTSEFDDVYSSLRETEHQLRRIQKVSTEAWKWATIALASACHGALVCNLSGTMQIGALTKCHAEQTIASFETNSGLEPPKAPKLAKPRELLKRARREDLRFERAGPALSVSSDQIRSFARLSHFRNQFLHFEPMGWSIEVSLLIATFSDILQIIDQVIDDGWSLRHLEEKKSDELKRVVHALPGLLDDLAQGLKNGA